VNLEEYWQENRRFVLGLAGGLVLFLIGLYVADAVYGTELRSARAQEAKIKRDLAQPMFTRAQLAEAEEDRERLRAAVDTLASTVAFAEREEFRLREGLGSASAQYHEIVGRLRDELLPAAARRNLRLEATLGLPKLSPTRASDIERYLSGLDLVERVARLAIDEGVGRMEELAIRLDPEYVSRRGTGEIETTEVHVQLSGSAVALMRVLARLERPEDGTQPATLRRMDWGSSRHREGDASIELVLVVARVTSEDLEDPEGAAG